jgi:hypothetical protein
MTADQTPPAPITCQWQEDEFPTGPCRTCPLNGPPPPVPDLSLARGCPILGLAVLWCGTDEEIEALAAAPEAEEARQCHNGGGDG